MISILMLSNSVRGLVNFRLELMQYFLCKGYDVYFAVPDPQDDKFVNKLTELGANYINVKLVRRGVNPIKDLRLSYRYFKIIRQINPDIVLTFTIKPNIYGTFVASIFKKPVIMNVTGLGTALVNPRLSSLVKLLYKLACKRVSHVFFQNECNRSFFLENKLVEKYKIELLPGSGVNIERFKPQPKKPSDKIRFLFIGRIMHEKGINEYLKVAEYVLKKFSNVEFGLLGGFEEDIYREKILNNSTVKYFGVSDDVRKSIAEADCIVNPSYHEGMSNALLEGAAMGKPLIATDIPGCREIIDHERNGFLCKPRSVESLAIMIERFMSLSEEERRMMGKYSRIKVEKDFNRRLVIIAYEKAIRKYVKKVI